MSFSLRLPGYGTVLSLKNVSMNVSSVLSDSPAGTVGEEHVPSESEVHAEASGLHDVTLSLRRRTFHSVLTNKPSPILRVMARLSSPESGTVSWSMPLRKRLQGHIVPVAYVSHPHSVPSALSVEDEFFRTLACAGAHIDEEVYENLMSALSIDSLRTRSCQDLSSCESLRVTTMRSVLLGARIVLFEEPTSGLSQREAEAFFSSLQRLAQLGYTVVVQTLSPDIAGLASMTFLLHDGHLVGAFDFEDLSLVKAEYTKFSTSHSSTENKYDDPMAVLSVNHVPGEDLLTRPLWQPTRSTTPQTLTPVPSAVPQVDTIQLQLPHVDSSRTGATPSKPSTLSDPTNLPDPTHLPEPSSPHAIDSHTGTGALLSLEEMYPSTAALPLIPQPRSVKEAEDPQESQAVIERAQDILKDLPGSILPDNAIP